MVFVFDVDGTLVKGDVTEGSVYFTGIVEHLYDLGLVTSLDYPTYNSWLTEYERRLDLADSTAFLLPLAIYNAATMDSVIQEYWESTISKHFIPNSLKLLREQSKRGDEIWIASASPAVFVAPIQTYLPTITNVIAIEMDQPISYGSGKFERVLNELNAAGKTLTGFVGDSWFNDGFLLSYASVNCRTAVYVEHGQDVQDFICKTINRLGIKVIYGYGEQVNCLNASTSPGTCNFDGKSR